MPYKIAAFGPGWKVISRKRPNGYSKKPLSYKMALKQLGALYMFASPEKEERRVNKKRITNKTRRKNKKNN